MRRMTGIIRQPGSIGGLLGLNANRVARLEQVWLEAGDVALGLVKAALKFAVSDIGHAPISSFILAFLQK